jgi:membrane protein DedA with SNARE-associated domain
MVSHLFGIVAGFIISTIKIFGYGGVALLMAIESACIPLPSEIILPFAGYLVFMQKFRLIYVALAGAFGCVIGSIIAYAIGAYGGRPLIEKYGKYILISKHDLNMADRWFDKYGNIIVFTGRLLPVIRTFISLPAGISRMNFIKFIFYTFIGSFIWSFFITWIGFKLGQQWDTLGPYFHRFDSVILITGILLFILYLRRHLRHIANEH